MDIFKVLEQYKDDGNILFEIIPNKDDIKLNKLKRNISNLKLDESKKRFLLSQINFQTGNYSIKDLYELINKYIDLIQNFNNPFNDIYPIIIDDKTYINNIALFLACLKLNLHPALIDVECLDDPNFLNVINSKENNFYICSSGTNHKKLVELNFDEVINTALSDPYSNFEKDKNLFVSVPLKGILGTYINIIYPLIYRCKTVIDTDDDFFYKLINNNINYCYLPNDFNMYLSEDLKKYDFGKIDRMFITGSYLSPQILKLLLKTVKIDLDRIIYMYGSTENNGFVFSNKLSDASVISMDYNKLAKKKIRKVKFYDLSHLLRVDGNKIIAEPLSLKKLYIHSLFYRKILNNRIMNPNVSSISDKPSTFAIPDFPKTTGLELCLSKLFRVEIYGDPRLSFCGRIHRIFYLYLQRKDKLILKHDAKFISVGKNLTTKNNIYSNNNDLFFIDKDGHVYMIYRDDKDNDFLQKTLLDMFGLPNVIEEDKFNLKITFEYPECNCLDEVIYFLRYISRLELKSGKNVHAYFDNLTKSKGLKKYISKSGFFSENFQDFLISNYELIFLAYVFKGDFNINDLITKINEIELLIKKIDILSKEELINYFGKYCFNLFVPFYCEDNIYNLKNLFSSKFVLSNNMLRYAKRLIAKTDELSKLICDKIDISEEEMKNLYENEMDFVRNERR